jgi:ACS family D-galactonate transporter-like MFS transporter
MAATHLLDRTRLSATQSRVLALLAVSVFINYIDRGNLSIAAPLLRDELGFSAWQLGVLLSSFFWTYALFQLVSGWLVDRFNANWVIAIGFFLWSWATVITGAVRGFVFLLLVRLVLGIGESVAYPCYSKILATHFAEQHRGTANSAISAGLACGPAFGTFVGGLLMARFGWRWFFIVFGLVSLIWLLPWFRCMPRVQCFDSNDCKHAPRVVDILRQPLAWKTCAGSLCGAYLLYFLITWLPFYMVRERHYSIEMMAKIAGIAYLCMAVSCIVSGRLSDRWIARGATPNRVRRSFMALGCACAGISLGLCVIAGPVLSVVLLIVATTSLGMWTSNQWAVTQTLAGPAAAGRWTGLQNFFGNLSGVIAPAVTGFVVERTGQFFWAFAITTGVALVGAALWAFVIGPIRPVIWEPQVAGFAANTGVAAPAELPKAA